MSKVIIYYKSKCKHCVHFKYKRIPKLNGEWSKRLKAYCENPKSEREGHPLTLKSKACDKIEL